MNESALSESSLLQAFYAEPWAITRAKLLEIEALLLEHARGEKKTAQEIAQALENASHVAQGSLLSPTAGPEGFERVDRAVPYATSGPVAYIPLHGTVMSRAGLIQRASGGVSPQAFEERVRHAAANGDVETILLSIDSPGGTVAGTMPAALAVREAAARKRVVAVAENTIASAAYWIGSQASRLVVGENANVGSIGVMMAHRDVSRKEEREGIKTTVITTGPQKGVGHPSIPLGEDELAVIQARLARHHDIFVKAVADGRGLSEDYVRKNLAHGGTFIGVDAAGQGLADEVGTLAQVASQLIAADQTAGQLTHEATMDEQAQDTISAQQEEIERQRAEISALEAELEKQQGVAQAAATNAQEAIQTAQQLSEQLATQRAASLEARAHALVDDAIIGAGKALPSQRESLIEQCQTGGAFDADRISFVETMYAGIASGAAVPVDNEVEEGAGRSGPTAGVEQMIAEQLGARLPQQYRA